MSKHGFFTKWIRLVIAAVVATPIALTRRSAAAASSRLPTVSAVDDAGPDDEPGQKDLNALSVDYGEPGADRRSTSPGTGTTRRPRVPTPETVARCSTPTAMASPTIRCA